MSTRWILGVSMSSHDRSAALLRDGHIVAAIAEERLDRRKRSEGFYAPPHKEVLPPFASISAVLREGGIGLDDVDLVACTRSISSARDTLIRYLPIEEERIVEPPLPGHHLAHAFAAFGTSPFEEAAILILDEQGTHLPDGAYERASWFLGNDTGVSPIKKFYGTHNDLSLGLFYNVFAAVVGLSEAGLPAAGKLMGLASCAPSSCVDVGLIDLLADGDFRIDLHRLTAFLDSRLGVTTQHPPKSVDDLLRRYPKVHWTDDKAIKLAAIAQGELERAVLHVAGSLKRQTGQAKLCFGGGIALNCLTNQRLLEVGFKDIYVHPAATDDGNAVGIALWAWKAHGNKLIPTPTWSPFLGTSYCDEQHHKALISFGLTPVRRPIVDIASEAIANNKIVCWAYGRSEWGPRALGGRSILASATAEGITDRLNRVVKHREAFRPFAVSWTADAARSELQALPIAAGLEPYMLTVGRLKSDARCKVKHVDGTVRYQIVDPDVQPIFTALLQRVGAYTGLEAVLNTSFNVIGEPVVETPYDAVRLFLLSQADFLILGEYVLDRQNIELDVFQLAVARAWDETNISPVEAAIQVIANGYLEEGLRMAREFNVMDQVMRRIGCFSDDPDETRRQAIAILERASIDPLGSQALESLRKLNNNVEQDTVLAAASLLARPGGIWTMAQRIGGKDV